MVRRSSCLVLFALGCSGSCGSGLEPTERTPIDVWARPRGSTFFDATVIELVPSRPSRIYYTLDPEEPIGQSSTPYEGPIRLEETALLTFIAVGDDHTWSEPKVELYRAIREAVPPTHLLSALEVVPESYFFLPEPGQTGPISMTVTLRSVGQAPVRVNRVELGVNPSGAAFFEPGIFSARIHPATFELSPGQEIALRVTYRPTITLRSAALVVIGDDELHAGGVIRVQLWGRVMTW